MNRRSMSKRRVLRIRAKKGFLTDNRGSTLLTVLIVAIFISILATTLLYVSGKNYQMKQTDYQNKQNFYEAEAALDELKACVVQDSAAACREAYRAMIVEYSGLSADSRKGVFYAAYANALQDIWNDRIADHSMNVCDAVKNIPGFSTQGQNCIIAVDSVAFDTAKGYFLIKGIQASSSTVDGYLTMITTDIYVGAPAFEWSVESSESWADGTEIVQNTIDLSDYVVFTNWRKN